MSDDEWPNVCILCTLRDRHTRLKYGHCCAACLDRITDNLRNIPKLAEMAAAHLTPKQSTGNSSTGSYGPRPPINLDAVDPALAHVPGHDAPLLVILEEWERMIRDQRGYAPYGVASASRTVAAARTATGAIDTTTATLRGVCAFLAAQAEWAATDGNFPLHDFADEIHQCMRAVQRWDNNRDNIGTMVKCPTILDNGPCDYRLHYSDLHEEITCRRCGAHRSAMTLAAVAAADGRDIWLDPEAAAQWLGVTEGTLRQWARKGTIQRNHGRYRINGFHTTTIVATM
jgi:hypothetical protein